MGKAGNFSEIRFYAKAQRQLADIWDDTERQWGEPQADRYLDGLYAHLREVAQSPALWRRVPHPEFPNVACCRYERHWIFFKHLSSGQLGIIAILHERMDLPRRLLDLYDEA